jgi:L-amino acid N-acyltransferase YncA
MTTPSVYTRWRLTVAELGAIDAFWYVLARMLVRLSPRFNLYKYYLVAQEISERRLLSEHRGRNVVIRRVYPGDGVLAEFPVPGSVIEARYRQGALCLAAFRDQELLGYAWAVVGPYDEDEVRSRFVPAPAGASAWDFDIYLVPSQRLGIVFPKLWEEVNRHLRAQGVRWTMSRISAFNPASLASHRRLGARIVGRVIYFVFGKIQLTLATRWPYAYLSFRQGRAPTFRVSAPEGVS